MGSLQERYNPNDEKDPSEQVSAANWELLRRIPEFRTTAERWVSSCAFRKRHSSEIIPYKHNPQARCALDWMLSPGERLELAKHQMSTRTFMADPSANHGPIIVRKNSNAHTDPIKKCIDRIYEVNARLDAGPRLSLDSIWPTTPAEFRKQFHQITACTATLQRLKLGECGRMLMRYGDWLLGDRPLTAKEKQNLGMSLYEYGEMLKRTDDFHIAAILRTTYPERRLDEILSQIKAGISYDPKTGNDYDSKKSFLGTSIQWRMFLAWEYHRKNAYLAAQEFLPETAPLPGHSARKRGNPSRSEIQRNIASSIRKSVHQIHAWYPRLYPKRDLRPASRQ